MQRLWDVFVGEDATLVEVNPLVRTADGRVIALDGKVTLDDNAAFRHPDHEALVDQAAADPLEARAKAKDLNYVKLDGEVGIIGNGAGLVMSTLDVVAYAGEEFGGVKPANFLDIGGGASAEVMADGLEIVLSDPSVRSVFVNVFGGITACDAVANGIVAALRILAGKGESLTKPLVVRLDGNNAGPGGRSWRSWAPTGPRPTGARLGDRAGRHDGRRRAPRGRARRRGEVGKSRTHGDLPHREEPGRRPGHDRLAGARKHTRRMLASGTTIVGGVNPGKAGQTVDFDGATLPVFGTVADAVKETGADVSVVFVPPAVHQGRGLRGRSTPASRSSW